jgi:hypothetical protein
MLHATNILGRTILNGSKKLAVIAALLLTIGISSSFASPNDELNREIKASFQKDFKKAQLMDFEVKAKFTKITFKMDDMILFAFYSGNGDLIAVTRNIRSSQLPIQLQMRLKNDFGSYWITELFELSDNDGNHYYVSLESADAKVILRSDGSSTWEVYQKTMKKDL